MKKINKFLLSFFLVFIVFIKNFNLVNAGPLDGLNIQFSVDNTSGNIGLKGQLTEDLTEEQKISEESFGLKAMDIAKRVVFIIFGIATLTMVIFAIIGFIKLGAAAGNPHEKSNALKTLLHTGIAIALLGGITLVTAVSIGIFK